MKAGPEVAEPASVDGSVAVGQTAAGNMGHDGKRPMKKDAGPWRKTGVSLSWRVELTNRRRVRIPTIATSDSDASRPPIPIHRDHP